MVDTKRIRENILRCSNASGHGHVPTSFSVIEMIIAAYDCMQHDPKNPKWAERDIFILSKGHASLGYYCCMAELGYCDPDDPKTFGAVGTKYGCHPDRLKLDWAEVSCGSLGHGISVGVGIALAFKIQKNNRRVFALIGDGESNEGTVWESVMIAADQKLDNLVILYDSNRSQSRCLQIPNPIERFKAFGCDTYGVDGHDVSVISDAINAESNGQPRCIVSNTRKGHGCETLIEEVFAWHRRSPNDEELEQLLKELNA